MPRNSRTTGPPASRIPIDDQHDRDARQGPPGRLRRRRRTWTSISPARAAFSSRIRRVEGAQSLDAGHERRGSGWATDGVLARTCDLGGDVDRLACSARSARSAASRSAARRSAWRAFSSMLRRSARTASASVRRSRALDSASRSRSSWASAVLALVERRLRLLDGLLGDLEPAGVPVAARAQVVERLVQLLAGAAGAAVGAADRRLEAIPQRALVARQVAQLEVVDRRGRAEEALGRDPGQLGHHLVGEGRVGDRLALVLEADRPLRAGERLLERADLLAVLVVLLELDGDDRAGLRRRVPRPERLELAGRARHPSGQGQLEGSLDGRLAGLVGSADDGQAGREARCRRRDSAGSRGR